MQKKKLITIMLMLGVTTSLFVGCGGNKSNQESADNGTLRLVSESIKTMDSVKASDLYSFNIVQSTQETLLIYNNNKPVPGAAESYDKSDDEEEAIESIEFIMERNKK